MNETMLWMRRQKGGQRRVTQHVVRVIGRTPSGRIVVERERRWRFLRDVVDPKNLKPLERRS